MAQPISQASETLVAIPAAPTGGVDLMIVLPGGAPGELLSRISASLPTNGQKVLVFCPQPEPPLGEFADQVQVLALPERALADRSQLGATPAPNHLGPGFFPWLFDQAQSQEARACVVLSSAVSNSDAVLDSNSGDPMDCAVAIRELAAPILEQNYDLALANYREGRFDGLIKKSIVYPLTRALYGLRVRYPLAQDFAFSLRLAESYLGEGGHSPASLNPPGLTTRSIQAGMRLCQVNAPFAHNAPKEQLDLSTVLAEMLNPLFVEMESNGGLWQRARGSQAVPIFGKVIRPGDVAIVERTDDVDIAPMVDAFQRGYRDLFEVWAEVLSPRTLLDLKKLARLPSPAFQMTDETWVRLVYEFALGHRQRVMNRDHLLRALTPLYLAWVASYALHVCVAATKDVEDREERLCLTFEASKPYLLSRWRWPDRFNP